MLDNYRKIYRLLDQRERRVALLVFILLIAVAIVEVAGVASLLPFMAILANPTMIDTNPILSKLYGGLGFASHHAFLMFLGVAMVFVLAGSLATRALGFYVQARFSTACNHALSTRLVESYLHQPYHWFLNRANSDLSSKVLGEVSQAVNGTLYPSIQLIANVLVVGLMLVLLILVDPILAVSTVGALGGAYFVVVFLGRKRLHDVGTRRLAANKARYQVVAEAFGGIKDVKVAGLEDTYLDRFRVPSAEMAKCHIQAQMIGQLPSFALQGLVFGGMALVLLYLMTTRGGLQQALPTVAVYALAGYRLMPALQAMYLQFSEIRYNQATLNALHADVVSLLPPPVRGPADRNAIVSRVALTQQLELRDVAYSYPGARREALRHVSMVVAARQKVGLVGASGSGKTTTVDVILGLLMQDAGIILVDGKPITAENRRGWQENVGYVPQQIFLIDDSVASNIAFGVAKSQIDMAAVQRAARVANLHEFVMTDLPDGYDTTVGERGIRLSGGQRQRIGIARALYRDPEVLILDEATSALDNLTEQAVMDAVDNLSNHKTILLVAHRLTTVKSCDKIFLFEAGRIVAVGTYNELLTENALFRAMAREGPRMKMP